MAAPISIATASNPMPHPGIERDAKPMVAAKAMAIPPIPNTMPERDDSCLDSPARLKMNSSAATTYADCEAVAAVTSAAPREHAEHAPGNGEATEDVDAGHQNRH